MFSFYMPVQIFKIDGPWFQTLFQFLSSLRSTSNRIAAMDIVLARGLFSFKCQSYERVYNIVKIYREKDQNSNLFIPEKRKTVLKQSSAWTLTLLFAKRVVFNTSVTSLINTAKEVLSLPINVSNTHFPLQHESPPCPPLSCPPLSCPPLSWPLLSWALLSWLSWLSWPPSLFASCVSVVVWWWTWSSKWWLPPWCSSWSGPMIAFWYAYTFKYVGMHL